MNDHAQLDESGTGEFEHAPAGYRIFVEQVLAQLHERLPAAVVYTTQFNATDNIYRVIAARGDRSLGIISGLEIPLEDAFCFRMATEQAPRYSPDAASDPAYAAVNAGGAVGTYAGAPIELTDGTRVGSLCIVMAEAQEIDPDSLSLLSVLATSLAHSLESEREVEALRAANFALRSRASTDALTGVANRQTFLELLEDAGDSGVLAMFSVDAYSDRVVAAGHEAGDRMLVDLARILSAATSAEQRIGRVGVERFAAILPQLSEDSGRAFAAGVADSFAASGGEEERVLSTAVSPLGAAGRPERALAAAAGQLPGG